MRSRRNKTKLGTGCGWGSAPLCFFLVALATGCSNFENTWQRMAVDPLDPDRVVGRWEGRWYSKTTGHGDTLRCIVTPRIDGSHDAWFRARFMRILAGEYHAELVTGKRNGCVEISAQADLGGLFGGVYRQEGRIFHGRYTARYESNRDRGQLDMRRPLR